MKCVICGAEAREVDTGMDGVELVCPECGHFRVSAMVLRQSSQRTFDVERTRIWLHREREINPDRGPEINSENVFWAS